MTITVYIADDHKILRDGLRSLLEETPDIKVVGDAGDGCKSVSDVKTLHPDVMLMDISMPQLNGIDATRLIVEASPQTRVIILSMVGNSEHIFRALQAGACGYLLKESAGREVIDAVSSVSKGGIYLSQPILAALIQDYVIVKERMVEKSPLDCLSQREREILEHVIDGKSSIEIGSLLSLSPKTIESYRSRMMQKLGVSDLPGLFRLAMRLGIIS